MPAHQADLQLMTHKAVARCMRGSSVQAQGANGAKLRYTGMTDVLKKTFQADGFKGLYRVRLLVPYLSHLTLCSL